MPDIAMCHGIDGDRVCPMRDRCYRFTAKPDEHRQSYFVGMPYRDETKHCEWFAGSKVEPPPADPGGAASEGRWVMARSDIELDRELLSLRNLLVDHAEQSTALGELAEHDLLQIALTQLDEVRLTVERARKARGG